MRNNKKMIFAALLFLGTPALAQQPPAASVVRVANVVKAEVAPTVAVPGTIYSRNDVQVTAGVTGQLLAVAEPGTFVDKGDPVARIDAQPLRLQRAEQEALLARAEINVRQLESQLRRQRELGNSSLVSEFDLEQTEANRDLAISDANITKVRIRQIDDQIHRANIRAPFSGVVISRLHRAGEDVARGEILARMTDIQNMEVRAFVPLKHLPRTTVGEVIEVFATATRTEGRIRALIPTGDIRSQTFEARIDLPNSSAANWTVGQLVSVAIPIRARQISLTVPRDALVLRSDGTFVFRVNEENIAEQVAVEIGDSSGDLVAVSGSLQEGDRIAIRGAENLRDGAGVKVVVSQGANEPETNEG
ncbi:MAG: efflux RND transporter periplasmic adaptor subunit [Gammaproteobacteria bacterium]|nr:efflux RND transporter periplasmic adaptor subunit [Gammaproteobacteria bacterium]